MKKIFNNKKNKATHDQLHEGLLAEGGGLNAGALAQLNGINGSFQEEDERDKISKGSAETYIEGLKQFNKYGDLFQDLTKRTYVDTNHDVVSIVITYDSKHAVSIVS